MCNELTDASQRISHGYSNTSSASTSSEGSTTRSSAFAVFRCIARSNLAGPHYRQIGWLFALQDAAHVDTGLPIHATPRRVTLKCGRSRHAQLDSSKLSADDPQRSAYASKPRGNNRLLWRGWRATPIPEKNSVLIAVGSLPIQTRQNVKMANAWATSSAQWGGGTTNIRRPPELPPTWSHRLHPNFIGVRPFHPKGRPELRGGSVTEGGGAPIFCRVTRQGGRSVKTPRTLCAKSRPEHLQQNASCPTRSPRRREQAPIAE
jgi:hypothetical protein